MPSVEASEFDEVDDSMEAGMIELVTLLTGLAREESQLY